MTDDLVHNLLRYAQSYYSLASCYPSNQPPPQVHIHIKRHALSSIPLGIITPLSPALKSNQLKKVNAAATKAEDEMKQKAIFDAWLREEWKKKDELMDTFYEKGEFEEVGERTVKIQIGLRGVDDWVSLEVTPAAVSESDQDGRISSVEVSNED